MNIRYATQDDLPEMIKLTLEAFKPIFESFETILGKEIVDVLHPNWQAAQKKIVMDAFEDEDIEMWVAEVSGSVAGLISLKLEPEKRIGEVYYLAVHPAYQNQGVGSALNDFVLEKMREAGMAVARVSTGGDPSHAPARRVYEKAGYIPLPNVNYFQKL